MKLSKVTTTVGLNIGKIECSGVTINFLDLGGQQELQPLWDKYYGETHGLIYLIDASDSTRFEESKTSFGELLIDFKTNCVNSADESITKLISLNLLPLHTQNK